MLRWTKQESLRVECRFDTIERLYWIEHPFESLKEQWDGYLWNEANRLIKKRAWNEFREWLMCELRESAIKDEMLDNLQYTSPVVYEWITSLCKKQCVASKSHPILPFNHASGAYLHRCIIEKRTLRNHAQAEKDSERH